MGLPSPATPLCFSASGRPATELFTPSREHLGKQRCTALPTPHVFQMLSENPIALSWTPYVFNMGSLVFRSQDWLKTLIVVSALLWYVRPAPLDAHALIFLHYQVCVPVVSGALEAGRRTHCSIGLGGPSRTRRVPRGDQVRWCTPPLEATGSAYICA